MAPLYAANKRIPLFPGSKGCNRSNESATAETKTPAVHKRSQLCRLHPAEDLTPEQEHRQIINLIACQVFFDSLCLFLW